VMLMFVMLALPTVPNLPTFLRNIIIFATLLFFGAMVVFFILAVMPQQSRRIYSYLINHLAPPKSRTVLLTIADNFMEGLSSLRSFKDVLMVFVTSVVIWLLETVKYWFVMHAFKFTVSFLALMMMNGVVNLATTIPSAPGYIGTFDLPGIEILRTFGVNPTVAASYTLALHVALWLPITLLGFWYMITESMSWNELTSVAAEKKDPTTASPEKID